MATQAATDREALRSALLRFAARPSWIPDMASAITDAIHVEMPELAADADLRVGTYASTESVLRLLRDMVERRRPPSEAEPPPAAVEYARDFVRRGVPIDRLLRAYHVGQATFFEIWVADVRAEIADPVALAQAIEEGATWTFEYLQSLTRDLIRRYADERERWVRSAAAIRAETVRDLVDGNGVNAETASRRLRYDLDREHLAYVLWTDEQDDRRTDIGSLERHASRLAADLGPGAGLVVPLGEHVVAGWVGAPAGRMTVPAGLRLADAPEGLTRAAFGRPGAGVDGFARSHREAMAARRVSRLAGRRPGTLTWFADVALPALASVDEKAAREFVIAELGALAADDEDARRLAATLRAYLEERSSARRTARRLGVHENTIKNRLHAAEELRGRPADERVAETLVALRLARLVGAPDVRTARRP
jgi:hypothetical protein